MSEITFQCIECDREIHAEVGVHYAVIFVEPCDRCNEAADKALEEAKGAAYDRGYEDGKLEGETNAKD
ncbi:hypothetical protein LCGC14_2996160 [marine sediment metagenome]|uniref:Uncharacterized protein n=1 Tax=marine sediment metagenome TaxID=412755 RepID=A0A0F8XPZ0_9ZZZZ